MKPSRLTALALAVLLGSGATLSMCSTSSPGPSSGSSSTQAKEGPLTERHAELIARAFHENHLAGSASFLAVTGSSGEMSLQGVVLWRDRRGEAVFTDASSPRYLRFEEGTLLEERPDLAAELASYQVPGKTTLVARPVDPSRLLDQILAFVTVLATPEPFDTSVVSSEPGSAFLRNDVLNDEPVVVLRFGTSAIYWIETGSSRLVRYEIIPTEGELRLVVDLAQHGTAELSSPDDYAVVPEQTLLSGS